MIDRYRTIKNYTEFELTEKKSKFIAAASSVGTVDEAQIFIDNIRKINYNATHNCFAFKTGTDKETTRYSDDGEPSGTAGLPILNAINSAGLSNVVVVVTRYFGGTLLGTGGLIRAYGETARQCLQNAEIIEKILYSVVKVGVDYGLSGKMRYEVLKLGHYIYNTVYTADVEYTVLVEAAKVQAFLDAAAEISAGTACLTVEENIYGARFGDIIEI